MSGTPWTMILSAQAKTDTLPWAFPFSPTEWELTPPAVQAPVQSLHQRVNQLEPQVETLQGRVEQTSPTSSKPPSSDSPFKKRMRRSSAGKRGATQGHAGSDPILLAPIEVQAVYPAPCAWGHGWLVLDLPYYTHQVIELPAYEWYARFCSWLGLYHECKDAGGRA